LRSSPGHAATTENLGAIEHGHRSRLEVGVHNLPQQAAGLKRPLAPTKQRGTPGELDTKRKCRGAQLNGGSSQGLAARKGVLADDQYQPAVQGPCVLDQLEKFVEHCCPAKG